MNPLNLLSSGGNLLAGIFNSGAERQAANRSREAYGAAEGLAGQGLQAWQNNPFLQQAQSAGGAALPALLAAFGLGQDGEHGVGRTMAAFRQTPMYQQQLQAGTDAITGNAAAQGLLGSGAYGRDLQKYGQGLASDTYNQYLGGLSDLFGMGVNTANTGVSLADNLGHQRAQYRIGGADAYNQGDRAARANLTYGTGGALGALFRDK